MGAAQMLSDLKAHLEHGGELLLSHVPALIAWAERAESDPLVQAAIDIEVPAPTRAMLAQLLKLAEADAKQIEADATARAQAAAQQPEQPEAPAPA